MVPQKEKRIDARTQRNGAHPGVIVKNVHVAFWNPWHLLFRKWSNNFSMQQSIGNSVRWNDEGKTHNRMRENHTDGSIPNVPSSKLWRWWKFPSFVFHQNGIQENFNLWLVVKSENTLRYCPNVAVFNVWQISKESLTMGRQCWAGLAQHLTMQVETITMQTRREPSPFSKRNVPRDNRANKAQRCSMVFQDRKWWRDGTVHPTLPKKGRGPASRKGQPCLSRQELESIMDVSHSRTNETTAFFR